MTTAERVALRQLYNFCCGYCGVSETDVRATLTLDHFQPVSRDGEDTFTHWVYCCFARNTAKGDYRQPAALHRILHPLRDNLSDHIAEQADGMLLGVTETGRFHIQHLRLNRPALVAHRLEKQQRKRERHRHAEVLRHLTEIQREIHLLRARLERQLRRE